MPLGLYQRKDSSNWWVRGAVRGQWVDQSTRVSRRADAEAVKAKLETDLFNRSVLGDQTIDRATKTFADAAVGYMQAGGEPDHLQRVLVEIGDKRLGEIKQGVLNEIVAKRPQLKASTHIRQTYTPILAVMAYAAEQGWCEVPTLRKPANPEGRLEWLLPAEAEAWIDSLPPHMRRLVVFYLGTGCRASEALDLEWKDVSPENERVVFWETKAGYSRHVDLPRRVRDELAAIRTPKSEGPVFRNSRGQPWHGYDAINLYFRKHAAKKGNGHLRPIHCHMLRHTWATWAYAVTLDLTFVMAQGGWRSLALLGRYAHPASPDLARAVRSANWTFIRRWGSEEGEE